MNTGGEAAEQIVRMSLEGFEVAAKITGAGAKNIAILLYSILKEEKKTKVSGVYLVLAALTVLFAVSLVFLHKTAYEGASHGNYTVTTQDKTDEITAPTRVVTLVNVNTADAAELETLTGIGPSLAQAIIDYRAEHGDFTAAEELLLVKGIGEAKLEGFRAQITFTEEDGNENSGG